MSSNASALWEQDQYVLLASRVLHIPEAAEAGLLNA
jgi:hypothetical protein